MPGLPPPDKVPRTANHLGRAFEIMATETDKSSELYVKIVGTLMVVLLAYGLLSLLGVVR